MATFAGFKDKADAAHAVDALRIVVDAFDRTIGAHENLTACIERHEWDIAQSILREMKGCKNKAFHARNLAKEINDRAQTPESKTLSDAVQQTVKTIVMIHDEWGEKALDTWKADMGIES